jgi:adenosylcobinamide-phosphate synthase
MALFTLLLPDIIAALLIAILLDFVFGEPPNRLHPVVFIGKIISILTKFIKRISEDNSGKYEKLGGIVLALGLPAFIGLITYFIATYSYYILGTLLFILISSGILKVSFSVRSMDKHIQEVLIMLEKNDIPGARKSLSKIVSRDTSSLDQSKILSACIESVAESFVDGILAPLFYYGFLNLPGCMIYRTTNTLDSMIAYKDKYHKDIGWMAAKVDTLLNIIPARISPIFLVPALMICKKDWRNALRIMKRDCMKMESFNAGIPMSLMAGGLCIQLEKIDHYILGDIVEELSLTKCKTSLTVAKIATIFFVCGFVIPIVILLYFLNWWNIFFGL